ncbi:MAG TPA: WG repeat-containing protein, partial [Pyrinomonadaceae bacterium]|nr:WG repeat-containing protein [Pyrinomonadaceae bacterium]
MKPRPLIQLVLLASTLCVAHHASLGQTVLHPIVEKGKWGYIDDSGTVVIKPQFDDAKPFYEGLGRVRVGAKWGFIDRTGEFAIPPQFELDPSGGEANDSSLDFHEGMAAISLQRGEKWGY